MTTPNEPEYRYTDGTAPQDRPAAPAVQDGSQSRPEASTRDESPDDFTHYVHLADGSVRKVKEDGPFGLHYLENEDDEASGGNKIIGVYGR